MLDSELSILAAYGIIVALTILVQTLGYIRQLGMGYIMSSRDEHRTVSGMTARLNRAVSNSVTALALFAPAVLILAILERQQAETLLAAQVFLMARIVYLPAYVFGIVGLRTLAWLAGFFATLLLYFMAL